MKDIRELRQLYKQRKHEIRKRLDEFKHPNKDNFLELCFCICTPMSKAERVIQVINERNKKILLDGSSSEIANLLRGYARFHNNKARYIVEARKKKSLLKKLPKNGLEARNFLLENFKGIGLKETSHFLRNVGYNDLAILDVHIIKCLYDLKVLGSDNRPSSRKQYEQMEEQFKTFSEKVKIPLDELDLLFWSSGTGKILK